MLVLTYTASLEYFERFVLSDARALGALVSVVSDARMVRADPVVVRRAGVAYLDGRAACPGGTAFHPKLLVIVGDGQARVAVGSGNLTMAGWHGNAETWVVLRADEDGGPETLRDVSAFLRGLSESEVTLSRPTPDALRRVADELDRLPADAPGPQLVHSLTEPIIRQIPVPSAPIAELVMYAPFHDGRLDGTRALLNRLSPARWTMFVRPDTVVNGQMLEKLVKEPAGRLAWASRHSTDVATDGRDERYWHGKIAQWRTADGETWTLTGSPNLSAPALEHTVGVGGNCELAVVGRIEHDLRPIEGDPPAAGLASLAGPIFDRHSQTGPLLLSAIAVDGVVTVELAAPLATSGTFERYDTVGDRWAAAATVEPGSDRYELVLAAAPIAQALRLRTSDGDVSNELFVADLIRLGRRQQRAIGKVRGTPEDVVRDGLGAQLLADLDELRPHLLAAGATVRAPRPAAAGTEDGGDELPIARPAPGLSLEEFLEACDPVLGQRMTEFALVLPALPGVGAALDDDLGTLDTDTDDAPIEEGEDAEPRPSGRTIREELRRQTPSERERYRWFVERLVERAPGYPLLVRNLCVRSLLHAIAEALWPDDGWPALLADALAALAAPGDEARPEERSAAGSLAAVGLAVLRTDVPRMSVRDERQMCYVATASALKNLLGDRTDEQVEMLAADLAEPLSGPQGAQAAEFAAEEALNPPSGVVRAARLLRDDLGRAARVCGAATVVLEEPVPRVPESLMIRALSLATDPGPVFARGSTDEGRPVVAAWQAPWLVVERTNAKGQGLGRAWRVSDLGALAAGDLAWDLPQADVSWMAGEPRPTEIAALLAMGDEDGEG
ncbi:MAG: hypothetical protein M3383_01235 [Actinomycetota bacterium]|nr:hypothetical protein [Actinomycetota bacterium]